MKAMESFLLRVFMDQRLRILKFDFDVYNNFILRRKKEGCTQLKW
jgi:hypothetical protein